MHTHWSQFVPNMTTDIRGHEALHYHHHDVGPSQRRAPGTTMKENYGLNQFLAAHNLKKKKIKKKIIVYQRQF